MDRRGRQPSIATLLLAGLLFAGCFQQPARPGESAGGPSGAVAPKPLLQTDALTGCLENAIIFAVPTEDAQALLPPGFGAQDATATASQAPLPVGAGRSLAGITIFQCASSEFERGPLTWAQFGIFIEPPNAPNVTLDPEASDAYELYRMVEGDRFAALLESLNYSVLRGAIEATFTDVAVTGASGGGAAAGSATDTEGPRFAFELAIAPSGAGGAPRWWHQTASGLGYFVQTKASEGPQNGAITICSLRAGTAEAGLLGADCQAGGGAALAERFDLTYEFHFLWGAAPA